MKKNFDYELDKIFAEYEKATETGESSSILQMFVRKYPQYERELTNFAAMRFLVNNTPDEPISLTENEQISVLTNKILDTIHSNQTKPIQSIESLITAAKNLGMKKIEFAKRIGLNPSQLYNLEIRRYIFSTIPNGLVETVAETLQTTRETIESFLNLTPSVAANYKSQDRPDEIKQVSFAQAIKEDETLSTEEKERLLNMK